MLSVETIKSDLTPSNNALRPAAGTPVARMMKDLFKADQLTVEEWTVDVSPTSVTASGKLTLLNKIKVKVKLVGTPGTGDGGTALVLSLTALPGSPLSLGALTQMLTGAAAPGAWPALNVASLTFTARPDASSYGIGGTLALDAARGFTICGKKIDALSLSADLNYAAGALSGSLAGQLQLAGVNFSAGLDFGDATTLHGAFVTDPGTVSPLNAQNLIRSFAPKYSLDAALNLGFSAAGFSFDLGNNTFDLAAQVERGPLAFMSVGKSARTSSWVAVFGLNQSATTLDKLPVIGSKLTALSFLTLTKAGVIAATEAWDGYKIPALPSYPGADAAQASGGLQALFDGDAYDLEAGVMLFAGITADSKAARGDGALAQSVKKAFSYLGNSELVLQATITGSDVEVMAEIDGDVTVEQRITLRDPYLRLKIGAASEVQIGGLMDFKDVQGYDLTTRVALTVNTTGITVGGEGTLVPAANPSVPTSGPKRGLPLGSELKAGMVGGITFTPPSFSVGLTGSFLWVDAGRKTSSQAGFGLVVDIPPPPLVPTPSYVAMSVSGIRLATVYEMFTGSAVGVPDLALNTAAIYIARADTVLPDASTAVRGGGFALGLKIRDFEVFGTATMIGSDLKFALATSKLDLGPVVIAGNSLGVFKPGLKKGASAPSPVLQALAYHVPDAANPRAPDGYTQLVAPGGPMVAFSSSDKRFMLTASVKFIGVDFATDVELSEAAMSFKLVLNASSKNAYNCSLDLAAVYGPGKFQGQDLDNVLKLAGAAKFSIGKVDVKVYGADFGTIDINGGLACNLSLVTCTRGFTFMLNEARASWGDHSVGLARPIAITGNFASMAEFCGNLVVAGGDQLMHAISSQLSFSAWSKDVTTGAIKGVDFVKDSVNALMGVVGDGISEMWNDLGGLVLHPLRSFDELAVGLKPAERVALRAVLVANPVMGVRFWQENTAAGKSYARKLQALSGADRTTVVLAAATSIAAEMKQSQISFANAAFALSQGLGLADDTRLMAQALVFGGYAYTTTNGRLEATTGASVAAALTVAFNIVGTTLRAGEQLQPGAGVQSANGRFWLKYGADGNLTLRRNSDGKSLWASNTANRGVGRFVLQADGNAVIYDAQNTPLWATNNLGGLYGGQYGGSALTVDDNGNIVVTAPDKTVLWSSNTCPGATITGTPSTPAGQWQERALSPGQWLQSANGKFSLTIAKNRAELVRNTDGKVIWSTGEVNSQPFAKYGSNRLTLQDDGNLVAYALNNGVQWSTNTYAHSTMNVGEQLTVGQWLQSPNGKWVLIYQADGNLVLYNDQTGAVAWASASSGKKTNRFYIRTDACAAIHDGDDVVWKTSDDYFDDDKAHLALTDDGKAILYHGDGKVIWDSSVKK